MRPTIPSGAKEFCSIGLFFMKVAIVGTGISGLSAAWALKDTANVTLFEKRDRIGGHSCTKTIDYDGRSLCVDVGFIVYNALNYPNLIAFFDALGVATQKSDMSFAVSNPGGYEWASHISGFFAWKRNLFRPAFHRFWRTILRFNDIARAELERDDLDDTTLGAWLDRHGFGDDFRENYILPMGAAIWSTPEDKMLDYPALSFFRFFDNHRLMHKERPAWRTVTNGSQCYVKKVARDLGDRIRTGSEIKRVSRFGTQVKLEDISGQQHIFDHVILASHSDQSLAMLDESFEDQRFMLRSVHYRPNQIYLHRDPSLMPQRRSAWAAWNVLKQGEEDICLTYWMNKLQGLPNECPLFVTLNPKEPPAEDTIFSSFSFDHPQFDRPAEAAVREIKRINGENGLWLAGAWMGSGFHEDGLKSGLEAALSLGGKVPWKASGIDPKRLPAKEATVAADLKVAGGNG
ncbi:MAG: FAD-dependent oxidoreductase [Pseudomonadota bacterium]